MLFIVECNFLVLPQMWLLLVVMYTADTIIFLYPTNGRTGARMHGRAGGVPFRVRICASVKLHSFLNYYLFISDGRTGGRAGGWMDGRQYI